MYINLGKKGGRFQPRCHFSFFRHSSQSTALESTTSRSAGLILSVNRMRLWHAQRAFGAMMLSKPRK